MRIIESLSWLWILFGIVGASAVIVGVWGEGWAEERVLPYHRQKWLVKLFWRILLIGLAFDLIGLMGSTATSMALESRVEQIRKSNNELASANLVLQTNVNETKIELANAEAHLIEVRNENLPMDIGDQYSLAESLKPLGAIQIELRVAFDTKAEKTAELLVTTFGLAGWPIVNRAFIGDIGEQGIVIGDNGSDPAMRAAHLLLKQLTDRNVPSEVIDDSSGFRVRGVSTNVVIVAVMQRPRKLNSDLMINLAKQVESRDLSPKIWARIMEIQSKRFTNSLELAKAQAEYNDLNVQYANLDKEQQNLSRQESELYDEIAKEESGTNSIGTGIHIFNSTIANGIPLSRFFGGNIGTNSTIIIHGGSFNSPPLQ